MNIVQWLIAPYLIGAIYKVRAIEQNEKPGLHQMVENISRKSGISAPKLMLAQIPLPNAFAYGSPLSGNRIAVTPGLLIISTAAKLKLSLDMNLAMSNIMTSN